MSSRRLLAAASVALALGAVSCRREQTIPPAPPTPVPAAGVPTPTALPATGTAGERVPTPGGTPALGSVTFSKTVNADHSPNEIASTFAPADTVIVSYYLADGRPENVVKVRWIAPTGTVLNEASSTLGKEGDGWGEFRINRRPGLDPGTYKVELYLDDVKAGEGSFTVEATPPPTPTP
ncbi:MAG TPA: hypothetical protein VIE39_04975 [Thermoanaerobaculia bacterium]|jgi:hypothetical protein